MASPASRRAHAARQLALGLALSACHGAESGASLDLVLPEGVGRRVELKPRSAFAEYVELPELRRELRVTIASYPLSCDRYVAPGPTDLLFVVTLVSPPRDAFVPGTFQLGAAPPADGGTLERSAAFAVAREGERGFDFPSGGTVELRSVDLSPTGSVGGVLSLEFPGDGSRPASGAHGKFQARMCHGG
ncbi:MAG TPA: hypothetical protein VNN72_11850 [Polyangiaceae bacterium]|nr:hypothetical protein [Polyangiaceae bacterium]